MTAPLLALLLALAPGGWVVDTPRPGVLVLRNEPGNWGGLSLGVAHQNRPTYQIRKTFDLDRLPAGTLATLQAARVRVWFSAQDYSHSQGDQVANGLDEAFELVVNEVAQRIATSDPRFPSRRTVSDLLRFAWTDFEIPTAALRPGPNTVLLRKLPSGKDDDYIYPGIDPTASYGTSATSMDGGTTWSTTKLNAIDASGEFMVRLVLLTGPATARAVWTPAAVSDAGPLLAYHGRDPDGSLRLEPDPEQFDRAQALTATIDARGAWEGGWYDVTGKLLPAQELGAGRLALPAGRQELEGLRLKPLAGGELRRVTLDYGVPTTPRRPVVNLLPAMAAPRGQRRGNPPSATVSDGRAVLRNAAWEAELTLRPRPALRRLQPAEVGRNVVSDPARCPLFRLRVGDRVYTAADSTTLRSRAVPGGVEVTVAVGATGLELTLTVTVDRSELRLGGTVTNRGPAPVDFYLACPALGGLQLSADGADDHYLFPWYGGIIAAVDTSLQSCYGDESAWWQMIDLFSPSAGGGFWLRVDDPTGCTKHLGLTKGAFAADDYRLGLLPYGIHPEMVWKEFVAPGPGLNLAVGYIRRSRPPGGHFTAPTAALGSHAGDWHAALRAYAGWSQRTWPPRPLPSKLTDRWQITASGWGQSPLFRDGAYQTEHLKPATVCVDELMSWWTWSEQGPWNTPMDQLEARLGPAMFKAYSSYWVKEPVSGKLMYPLNRGDYDGYMPAWGGLPALRVHLDAMRAKGILPTFYTDGILACANTKVGREFGPQYGVMDPAWDPSHGSYGCLGTPPGYVGSYGSYQLCADTTWTGQYLADTMARVCRETGVDGLRLDEYGHRGYVCYSPRHQHRYAEPGHNEWIRATADIGRQVHAALDKVRPGLVLTAEFPGTDQLASALDGCIVYETIAHVRPIRPTPVNLFRFYFPACKVYDLQNGPVRQGVAWRLFNAMGCFGYYQYDARQLAVLRRYVKAFEGEREPLVPTLRPLVYANRFRGGGVTIWALHNATGHTVDGALLAVRPAAGQQLRELLGDRPLSAPDGRLRLLLRRDETVLVGLLPSRAE